MGKSGPRNTHIKIIDRSELKSPARTMMEHTVTTVLWGLWIYWMLPIITILLWALGIKMTYLTLFDPEHLPELVRVMKFGGISILSIFIINILWINYNYHFIYKKFGQRRRQGRVTTDKDVAKFFSIDPESLIKIRRHNRFEMTLSDNKASVHSSTTVFPSPLTTDRDK